MATSDSVIADSGIQKEEWCNFDEYIGAKAALVAAGVADASKFPGDPGNNKTSVTYKDGSQKISIQRAGERGYRVRRWVSDAVRKERDAEMMAECREDEAKRYARFTAEQEGKQARGDLERITSSPDQFRKSYERWAALDMQSLFKDAQVGDGGYSFSQSSIEEIHEAADELMSVIRLAEIVYSKTRRDAQILRYRARIAAGEAAGDHFFQSFMERVALAAE